VRPGRSLLAYAFAHVDVPADGYLYITASCDAAMAWFVDGVSVYDRMRLGNAAPANDLDAHPFAVRVTRGRHVLAVMTGPSSSGWSFRSLGGFSQKRADEMPGLRVESRQPTPMPDFRLHACFQEVAHTPTMERMWLDRIACGASRRICPAQARPRRRPRCWPRQPSSPGGSAAALPAAPLRAPAPSL
jgi:hypothetical protein